MSIIFRPKTSEPELERLSFPPRLNLVPNDFNDRHAARFLPTGTVTLLLADIEGSTRLWETQPDEMAAALATMDRTLAELVHANNGVCPIEQGEGDSFVVAFTRASDAVACALALQQAALAPIRLRIGVYTGEVQLRDEGKYMGPTINRAARLRELGHGGQTLLSGITSDLVCERMPEHAWLIDFGRRTLRDLSRPERVSSALPSRPAQRIPAAANPFNQCPPPAHTTGQHQGPRQRARPSPATSGCQPLHDGWRSLAGRRGSVGRELMWWW